MKKINILIVLGLLLSNFVMAQNVGIGTIAPDESAILDLSSSKKGLLIPRMTHSQKVSISKPADGLMVYQTDLNSGIYVYNGSKSTWTPISTSGSVATANSVAAAAWEVSGNTGITSAHYIGTPAGGGNELNFKINGYKAGNIGSGASNPLTNTSFGYRNLEANTTGFLNSSLGFISLISNTTGYNNSAYGAYTLWQNTTGYNNLAVGGSAMYANTTGYENVAIGAGALQENLVGNYNLGVGYSALRQNNGTFNSALGYYALTSNTTGGGNFGLGAMSLKSNTTGSNNISIGFQSGFSNITGSNNVFIGNQSGFYETNSNKLYIANTLTTTPLVYGDFSAKFVSIGDIPVASRDAVAASGQYGLLVKGGILTEKLKVALASTADWADYVFEPGYKLMPIEQMAKYTQVNKHLPNVPSAKEMAEGGLDVSKTSQMFMEKIEELSLYIIQLNDKIKSLEKEIESLK